MLAPRLTALLAVILALAVPGVASAALAPNLVVPLDRTGAVPGTVTLHLTQVVSPTPVPSTEVVIPLAGGPGQAALPVASSFAKVLKPLLASRDMVVFDQRGTGTSNPLRCRSFGSSGPSTQSDVRSCAAQLGAARGFYRSVDSAEDIEAIRVAGGYAKVLLYGVSYGTKVALTYAALHPDRVSGLILDSVVPVDGPEAFSRSSFAAVPRMLRELCARGACRAASRTPSADLRTLIGRLKHAPISGPITSPSGRARRQQLTEDGLWDVLLAGDLNPALRAELPGAVRAALRGDRTPILRLRARAAGLTGTAPALQEDEDGIEPALFVATRCEESPFPWNRASGAVAREAQARAAARAIPAKAFRPFDRDVALDTGVLSLCAAWPDASPAPAALGPLPAVPTLVLTGSADLRTPVEQARAAVASIPGARVDVIPQTGHSVLGADLSGCAALAITAFATGAPDVCTPKASPITPTRVPPRSIAGFSGSTRAAKTLAAVRATLTDVRRQLLGDALSAGRAIGAGSRTGGLRGGVAVVQGQYATLKRMSYVPGVRLSGNFGLEKGARSELAVTGPAAAAGRLSIDSSGRITGTLGGTRVATATSAGRVSSILDVALPHPLLRAP